MTSVRHVWSISTHAVRQDDAFRVGCRAGCISNRRVVVIFDRQGGVEERYQRMGRQVFFSHTYHFGKRDLFFAVFRLIVHHDHLLDKGQAVHDGAYLLQLVAGDEDIFHIRMHEAEQQVVGFFQLDRERDVGRTGVEHRQFADDPGIPAFGEERHVVAFLYAERNKTGAGGVDLLPDCPVAGGNVLVSGLFPQERHILVYPYRVLKKVNDCLSHICNSVSCYILTMYFL